MVMTAPDGALAPALDRLYSSTADLIDPIKQWTGDRMLLAPSLYQQLVDDIPARATDWISRSGYANSTSPVYIDAVDVQREIDDTVRSWCPTGDTTVVRLRHLNAARWRPQDVHRLERITADLDRWAFAIRRLLDPEPVKAISAPCPACGARYVYRMNKAGERVRQAALQIVASVGCTCTMCATHWTPDKYLLLCRVLGFESPAGVLPD